MKYTKCFSNNVFKKKKGKKKIEFHIYRFIQQLCNILFQGGVVEIQIVWNCNLDYSVSDCVPQFKFRRLDSADYKISKGYNFR